MVEICVIVLRGLEKEVVFNKSGRGFRVSLHFNLSVAGKQGDKGLEGLSKLEEMSPDRRGISGVHIMFLKSGDTKSLLAGE